MHGHNLDKAQNEAALAAGVNQYGLAFAEWAEAVGVAEADQQEFRGSYLGSWSSISAFGRQFAAELGLNDRLDLPAAIQPYVELDTDALVMDMLNRRELQTIEDGRGIVHVFLGPGYPASRGDDEQDTTANRSDSAGY